MRVDEHDEEIGLDLNQHSVWILQWQLQFERY
jgi:hypothetical protein